MKLREFFEDVTGPGVTTAPFLKDGPLKVSKHFTQRLKEHGLDLKKVAQFISRVIKRNKAQIEGLPVNTSFVLKSRTGFGVAITKQETPEGIVYLINTAHPNLFINHNQEVFLGDSKLLDKPTPKIKDLSQKYNVSLKTIVTQLMKGIKIESEHTSDPKIAKEIALDHLGEDLYYYKKLEKIEDKTEV